MLNTGAEKAVAATKTFTSSLAVLAALSAALEESKERSAMVRALPDLCDRTIELVSGLAAARAERYRYMHRCVVISRGFCYGVAMEIALKLKELTYVTAEPYSSADFMHGPMAMLEPGFPVVLVAPSRHPALPHARSSPTQLQERKSEIIAISDSRMRYLRAGDHAASHGGGGAGMAFPGPRRDSRAAPGPSPRPCQGNRPGCSSWPQQGDRHAMKGAAQR